MIKKDNREKNTGNTRGTTRGGTRSPSKKDPDKDINNQVCADPVVSLNESPCREKVSMESKDNKQV